MSLERPIALIIMAAIGATLNNTLPKGLVQRNHQRFNPDLIFGTGNGAIIPFIPEEDNESEEERKTVKVKLPSGVEMYFRIFKQGGTEDLLKHIMQHESIVTGLSLSDNIDTWERDRTARRTRLGLMDADDEGREELVESIAQLGRDITAAHERGYQMMQLTLDPSLHEAWTDVVTRMCDTANYVDEDGVRHPNGPARGRLLNNLQHCYREMVRWSTDKRNAAELQSLYENTCVKSHWTITSAQFINRKVQMNKYRAYLPCLKNEEGSPQAMTRASTPLTDVELCPILLTGLLQTVATAYWAYKGHGHFPTNVEAMKRDLAVIEPQVKLNQELNRAIKDKNGNSGKKNNGKRSDVASSSRKQDGSSQPSAKKRKYTRYCRKCAKHSPDVKDTHNTEECFKWNDDGTQKVRRQKNKSYSSANSNEMKELRAMFTEWKKVSSKKEAKSSRKQKDEEGDSDSE